MPDATASAAAPSAALVTAYGIVRGVELAGPARLDVADATAALVPTSGARVQLALAQLDGAREAPSYLTLYVSGGDVIELAAAADAATLDVAARRLATGALALPELTRGLRALGSARGMPGSDHDRFFAPFLEAVGAARRAVASRPHSALVPSVASAAAAPAMAATLRAALRGFAVSRFPERAPHQRALEAELLELAEPTFGALDALDAAARALAAAEPDTRFARWRAWTSTLGGVLAAADRCWLDALPVLADARGAPGRSWRGVVGRGQGGGAR